MRILVAVRALVERYADILRLAVRSVRVALGALYLYVQTRQWITGFRVVELSHVDRFPVDGIVAGLAVLAEASFVLIFVARGATTGQSEVGAAQVFLFDRRTFLRRNVRWIVALVTGYGSMLAFQNVSGLFVIESLDVPLDKGKIVAVMLGVAAGALLA